MNQHALSTLVLLLVTACQSVPKGPAEDPDKAWREQIEYGQAELMREIDGVRALLAARATASSQVPSSDVGLATQSLDALEWTAKLANLSARMDELQAAMGGTSEVSSLEASHSRQRAPAAYASDTGAIKVLERSLLALAKEHAAHCENITNLNVPGYKRRVVSLATEIDVGSELQTPVAVGTQLVMTQGVLGLTGNELDFGIEGRGFFEVSVPDGSLRYTRNGSFRQDYNGRIVTQEGYLLTSDVTIPADSMGISISNDGQVFCIQEGNNLQAIGSIRLSIFASAAGLKPLGPHHLAPTAESGPALARLPGVHGAGSIRQGYLERANVNITTELIDLQLVERQAAAIRRVLASQGIYAR